MTGIGGCVFGDASLLSIARDLIVIVGSGVAIYVGLSGLHTWKRQLRGATKHEVSRKVLRTLTRLQDAIIEVKRVVHERAFFSRAVAEGTARVYSSLLSDPDSVLQPRMRRVTREHAALADEADDVMYLFESEAKEKLDEVFQVFAKFELGYAIESSRGPEHKFTGGSGMSVFYGGEEADRFDRELNAAFTGAIEYFRRQLAGR